MSVTIATMLRREREAAGISQLEVGHRVGVTALTVGKWERGQSVPALRYRGPLSRWLGCSPKAVTDACIAGAAERREGTAPSAPSALEAMEAADAAREPGT